MFSSTLFGVNGNLHAVVPETTLLPYACSNVNVVAERNFHGQGKNDVNHILHLLTACTRGCSQPKSFARLNGLQYIFFQIKKMRPPKHI